MTTFLLELLLSKKDGKYHGGPILAYLMGKAVHGAGSIIRTVTGTLPLTLANSIAAALVRLVRYGKVEQRRDTPAPVVNPYLTFSAASSFILGTGNTAKNWDGTLEYSTDATTWQTWAGTSGISSSSDGKLYLRGTGNTTLHNSSASWSSAFTLSRGVSVSCEGNIETLLDYQTVVNGQHPTMGNYCFCMLFADCTSLITAPSFPATTLSQGCYEYMFYYCTGLTSLPELPATALTAECYYGMFDGCNQIKLSTTQTGEYTQEYRIPSSGTGADASYARGDMFSRTGGSWHSTPALNTIYYLSNTNTIVPATPSAPVIPDYPTPEYPMDIWCNNGKLAARHQSGLPLGYTLLDYARSSGTQYIDLGYKGNGNTKVEVKFKYHTATSATGSGRVFGSRYNAQSSAFAIGTSAGTVASTATNKVFWCYDGQPFYVANEEFGLDVWKTVVFSATEHTINGVSVGDDYNIVAFETPQNLKLFGFDNAGTMGFGYVDVEYCKLWNNGVLVRNLVPTKNAANVVGMYDFVSGEFLTNEGTGSFTAGSAVSDPIEIYTDGTPEVLTVCGKNLYNKANGVLYGYPTQAGTWAQKTSVNDELTIMVKLKEGETYTATRLTGGGSAFRIQANDTATLTSGQSLYIVPGSDGTDVRTFTVPIGYPYVLFYVRNTYTANRPTTQEVIDAFQVELGSTATAYEPYVTPQTATVPTLLAVGDYKDSAELISGIKTGKIGIKVFTGNEVFLNGQNGWITEDVQDQYWDNATPYSPLCTHFVGTDSTPVAGSNTVRVYRTSDNTGRIYFGIDKTLDAFSTREKFAAWLAAQYAAGNPVIVIYVLATETTETTTLQALNSYNGTTVVSTVCAVLPVDGEAEYKASQEPGRGLLMPPVDETVEETVEETDEPVKGVER